MSNQKQMTKAEIQDALECFVIKKYHKDYRNENLSETCENCPYIDFCHDLEKVIKQKPKKYL